MTEKKCVPCEGGTPPLTMEQVQNYLKKLDGWLLKDNCIKKEYRFKTYMDGLNFVYAVGQLAEDEGHHPDIFIGYKKVRIALTTYSIGGLSENDFILATKIDEIKF
ncbi:MAG: 4a-hydroxytetrahydrobiopterin dehydratase [Nitrosopumilaceae archaeon]